jgi:DNA-directed RNA polymerase subunit alpha
MLTAEDMYAAQTIDWLNLKRVARNSLRRVGVDTVGKLIDLTEWQLLSAPGLGKKSLAEVKAALANMDLNLRSQSAEPPPDMRLPLKQARPARGQCLSS